MAKNWIVFHMDVHINFLGKVESTYGMIIGESSTLREERGWIVPELKK